MRLSSLQLMVGWLLGMLLLSLPALYNGYPLWFWETSAYVRAATENLLSPSSNAIYAGLVYYASIGTSFWFVIGVQSFLLTIAIYSTFKYVFVTAQPWTFLFYIFLISSTTAASYHSSHLMPDVFTPIMLLSAGTLLWGNNLSKRAWIALSALLLLSVSMHNAQWGILIVLLVWNGLRFLYVRLVKKKRSTALTGLTLGVVGGLTLASYLLVSTVHYQLGGEFKPTRGEDFFLFGRLCDYSIPQNYLTGMRKQRDALAVESLAALRVYEPNQPQHPAIVHYDSLFEIENYGELQRRIRYTDLQRMYNLEMTPAINALSTKLDHPTIRHLDSIGKGNDYLWGAGIHALDKNGGWNSENQAYLKALNKELLEGKDYFHSYCIQTIEQTIALLFRVDVQPLANQNTDKFLATVKQYNNNYWVAARRSRQATKSYTEENIHASNQLQRLVLLLSLLWLLYGFLWQKTSILNHKQQAFTIFIALSLVVNALVTVSCWGGDAYYQSRVAWLVTLPAFWAASQWWERWTDPSQKAPTTHSSAH